MPDGRWREKEGGGIRTTLSSNQGGGNSGDRFPDCSREDAHVVKTQYGRDPTLTTEVLRLIP